MRDSTNKTINCCPKNDSSRYCLLNQLNAMNKSRRVHPKNDCAHNQAHENEANPVTQKSKTNSVIIGSLIGLLAICSLIFGFITFWWRRQEIQEKINLVSKWSFHAPKEAEIVQDSEEFAHPREEKSHTTLTAVEVERDDQQHSKPPDSANNSMQPDEHCKPAPFNKHVNRISTLSMNTASSRSGSIIIHEDL